MATKKLKGNGIFFTGMSANDVTGSQYYIQFGNTKCLIECGLHQSSSNDYLDSYKINSEKFMFKPSELDYVFVAHAHIDHCGLIPRLVKEGFHGNIIATAITAKVMKPLLLNSCFIIQDEARVLSKRYHREYKPIYEESDVHKALGLISVYDQYRTVYTLNENVSFEWLRNSHCVGAAQLRLILRDGTNVRKVLYSSDIGAIMPENHYVMPTEIPEMFNDVTIMESTYGNEKRDAKKPRSFDVKHLESAIDTTLERGGTVVFPCFSFARTQEILTTLYEIYGAAEFRYPIFVDSKLSCEICDLYSDLLQGEDLAKWRKIWNWKNLRFISGKEESKANVANTQPKIVISSSGFCTNGRIVSYLKQYVPDRNSMIVFSGYVGDNPSYLSYRIKNYRNHPTIKVNKEIVANRADCIGLYTFSSHANCKDLVRYGSNLLTNKLVLVHGEPDAKKHLRELLELAIPAYNRTYKVVESHKGMMIHL